MKNSIIQKNGKKEFPIHSYTLYILYITFMPNCEESIIEEPCAVVPHAGICAVGIR